MSPKSITMCLLHMLEDLSASDFEKFCHSLMHRSEKPRVRRNRVEDKTRIEITDVLVSTFTEDGAVGVAVEVLRQIDCNQAAEDLVREVS